MTIGKKIKLVRKFRKMTQQQLGEAIGIEGKEPQIVLLNTNTTTEFLKTIC